MIAEGWATFTELQTTIDGNDVMVLNEALDTWLAAKAAAQKPKE